MSDLDDLHREAASDVERLDVRLRAHSALIASMPTADQRGLTNEQLSQLHRTVALLASLRDAALLVQRQLEAISLKQ